MHTANSFPELIYIPREGIAIGFILFADDNLSPLSLTCADKMDQVLTLYDNTLELVDSTSTVRNQLSCVSIFPGTQTGTAIYSIQTQHLGLELGPDMSITLRETRHKFDLNIVKCRILASAPTP
jgi:hypothetical protein